MIIHSDRGGQYTSTEYRTVIQKFGLIEYPQEIRRIIYTTNTVEAYHRMVRKFTKSKAIFPTDDSIKKVVYMSVKEIAKKWTMPVRDWGLAYHQFMIFFEDRFAA